MRGLGMSASCKQVIPAVGLKHCRMLHVETLTSLHPRLISRSGWRKPSSPLPVRCKVKLESGPRSSW